MDIEDKGQKALLPTVTAAWDHSAACNYIIGVQLGADRQAKVPTLAVTPAGIVIVFGHTCP